MIIRARWHNCAIQAAIAVAAFVASGAACASDAEDFTVSGSRLIFDTESNDKNHEISSGHVDIFLALLKQNPGITTLVLNSSGGSVWAGTEMGRIALDFELNTVVDGQCSSSCVMMFLAGGSRSMERGSKIGFHSRSWSPRSVETYYEKWREDENWETPFDFASWVYKDTRKEVYDDLIYILSRGVDPTFAIKSHAPRKEMWYPTRQELVAAGVLTE